MKNVKAKTNEQIAMQVSANSIAVNLMLSIFKLIAGLLASSGAMISDAIHSASDVFSTIIVIIGVKISGKASDEDHPYGHDRFECVASIILAILLGVTGVGIGLTDGWSLRHTGSTWSAGTGGSRYFYRCQGNHVLVYKKCSQED